VTLILLRPKKKEDGIKEIDDINQTEISDEKEKMIDTHI